MTFSFDANKGLENPVTRKFTIGLIGAILLIVVLVLCIAFFDGKHNKISKDGIETNIPNPSKDSIVTKDDHSTHIVVHGDYVNGDKTVIVLPTDTSNKKKKDK